MSDGWLQDYGNEYGYAHGVVDAGLAVKMAAAWHQTEQTLAPEKTVLALLPSVSNHIITAAQVIAGTQAPGDEALVPGALFRPGIDPSGDGNFNDYMQEFYKVPTITQDASGKSILDPKSLPFAEDNPPADDRGSPVLIDGPKNMVAESIDVQLDIGYTDAKSLDNLRIVLISPDGTQSELTNYQYPGSYDIAGGNEQSFRATKELFVGGIHVFAPRIRQASWIPTRTATTPGV